MLEILPYDIIHIDKSYEFLLETFHISFGPDKAQWPNNLGDYPFEKYKADIKRLLTGKDCFFFSAYHNGQVVGQIELRKLKDGCGYISFYYLIPQYRNRGLGRDLDEFAVHELKRQGCHKVRLAVSELNKAGQRFYEKNGWKSLGPDPNRPLGLIMEKDIE
ncbi:MAG: GNAT family N-acetyltransferase [Bdellovibrio sp.]